MKKNMQELIRYGILATGFLVLCLLAGCGRHRDPMEKIKDLEFTVLAEENIPEELRTVIEEKKSSAFKVTYQDNGFLYIYLNYRVIFLFVIHLLLQTLFYYSYWY